MMKWTLRCVVTLFGALLLAVGVGRTQTVPGWYGFMACSMPCWAGVQPGVTSVGQADQIFSETLHLLESPGYYRTLPRDTFRYSVSRVRQSPPDALIPVLYVRPTTETTIGEIVARFGPPDQLDLTTVRLKDNGMNDPDSRSYVYTLVYHRLGMDVATEPLSIDMLTPDATVYMLTLSRNPDFLSLGSLPWRGFGSAQRYQGETVYSIVVP